MRRLVGYVTLLLLVYFGAILCAILWPIRLVLFGPRKTKESARAADQLINATMCNGLGRESLSSSSWRNQRMWVIKLTDMAEPGHCQEANRREQPVVDFIATMHKD